uniref:CPR9 n=1 Tax=Ostrinia furnacalis TaxID=93504 RepID=A0A5J6DKN1_OSTFU|nr:CPR9 [Ostrinia furnacalis]
MKSFVAFALFVAVAAAIPVSQDPKDAVVVRYDNDNIGVEGYNYAVETSDGKSAQEQGQLKNVGTENEAIEVRGQYSYTGPDGVVYSVTYVANELGFQPQGAHIPQA